VLINNLLGRLFKSTVMNLSANRIWNALKRPFDTRYRFYTSLVFFLVVAFIYVTYTPVRYKVSSKIALNNNSGIILDSVADNLKSGLLVKRAVSQLPFEVNYYKENSPGEELYGDSLPVKLILNNAHSNGYTNKLIINPLSSHSFSIDHEDTIQFYEINEQVSQYYGKFKVVRGTAFKSHFNPVIVRFNELSAISTAYYKNLDVDINENANTIELSILVRHPQKGQDFLNKLLELYKAEHKVPTSGNKPGDQGALQALKSEIAALKLKASKKASVIQSKNKPLSSQQLMTLEVIKPYLQKPINQFVQVPYIDEVQDATLQNDLNRFNKAELDKQRMLGAPKVDDVAVSNIDRQLAALKIDLAEQVNTLHSGKHATERVGNGAIAQQLQKAKLQYQLLSRNNQNPHVIPNTGIITIIEKPGYSIAKVAPNKVLTFALALLLGFMVPALFNFFSSINTSITSIKWFNSQTLIEKIKILLGARQID
jgi:tyrosine-protein kinase Etk/Wzc